MTCIRGSSLLLSALLLGGCAVPNTGRPQVDVVSGSRPDGSATALWLTLLRRRLPAGEYDSVARIRRTRTPEEAAWAALIQSEARAWPAAADSLAPLFDLADPQPVQVVLGNRGGEDAFTHDSMTMGMDLSALQRVYGAASDPENRNRVNRFFRHEFVHTLQKRWLAAHPFVPRSFLEVALLDAWAEGLGNYYSLSDRWQPTATGPATATMETLAELEPRFVSRMAGLACADSASARLLLADLSSGPFTRKWGALPVALWLLSDESREPGALHTFAVGGPAGVWNLAQRHLPPALADSLAMIRQHAGQCRPEGP